MYGGYVLHLANKEALQNAKLELKKSKRKDYYKILGVDKQAGEDEIKKAYKKRALLHHPGKTNSYLPRKGNRKRNPWSHALFPLLQKILQLLLGW